MAGEGEHKLIDFIRKSQTDVNLSHCIYGNDADLINLALTLNRPKIAILRENNKAFSFLYLSKLRDYMELEF